MYDPCTPINRVDRSATWRRNFICGNQGERLRLAQVKPRRQKMGRLKCQTPMGHRAGLGTVHASDIAFEPDPYYLLNMP